MFEPVCYGYNHEFATCKYIYTCDLIINASLSGDSRESYIIGRGVTPEKCKRDNPNFRPMTKREFIEAYKRIPRRTTDVSLKDLWESLRMEGLVEDHEYGRNY